MRYLVISLAMIITTALSSCGKKNDSVATPPPNSNVSAVTGYGTCMPGQYGCVNGYLMSMRVAGSLTSVGQDALAEVLGQYGGFCQNNGWNNWPGQLNYTYTIGSYNCKSYTARSAIEVRFDQTGTRAQIILRAGSHYGMMNSIRFDGQVFPINNSTGLEIRGYGQPYSGSWSAQYNEGIVITVQAGSATSLQMNGEVQWRGRHMGDVVLYRY